MTRIAARAVQKIERFEADTGEKLTCSSSRVA